MKQYYQKRTYSIHAVCPFCCHLLRLLFQNVSQAHFEDIVLCVERTKGGGRIRLPRKAVAFLTLAPFFLTPAGEASISPSAEGDKGRCPFETRKL